MPMGTAAYTRPAREVSTSTKPMAGIAGTVLVILVVSFNLLGDAFRDALDPKAIH